MAHYQMNTANAVKFRQGLVKKGIDYASWRSVVERTVVNVATDGDDRDLEEAILMETTGLTPQDGLKPV